VIETVGIDIGKQVIEIRKRCRELMAEIGGKPIHPVLGLPGGVAKAISGETAGQLKAFAADAVAFAHFTLKAFDDIVLKNKTYLDLVLSDYFTLKTNYMGMVDGNDRVNFYDGDIKVVDPEGKEIERFNVSQYADVIAEHVEPWSYVKFPYLKKSGWEGFVEADATSIYRVAPTARLNAADGMATPQAQEQYERMFNTLGGKPVHSTLAIHWARLIEVLYAAERLVELSSDSDLTGDDIRNMDFATPVEGIGAVEAPRGTLIHHYTTDANGIITGANLIVATLNNSAAINMSIEKAARTLIRDGNVDDGLLNMVEMAFRAYDPCLSCATHAMPGKMPLVVGFLRNGKHEFSLVRDEKGNRHIITNTQSV
jgi:F420-non-reducing hydrogenase large subunit